MSEESGKAKHSNRRDDKPGSSNAARKPSHMPRNSVLFEKIVPATLVIFSLLTVGLIVFGIAVLLGLVSY